MNDNTENREDLFDEDFDLEAILSEFHEDSPEQKDDSEKPEPAQEALTQPAEAQQAPAAEATPVNDAALEGNTVRFAPISEEQLHALASAGQGEKPEESPAEQPAPAAEPADQEDGPKMKKVSGPAFDVEEEFIPAPELFTPRPRLRELKKKLVSGPEMRYYALSEIGTGRLQLAILVSLVVAALRAVVTVRFSMGLTPDNRLKLVIFSQVLCLMLSGLMGIQLMMDSVAQLFKGRFTVNTLLTITFAVCMVDGFFCLKELRVPCCCAFSLEMAFALWARLQERTTEIAQLDTMRKAVRLHSITRVKKFYNGKDGLLRSEGEVEDFMDTYQQMPAPQLVQSIYAGLSLVACIAIAVLALLRTGSGMALQIFATSLLVAVPASYFVSISRPSAILEQRLHMVGTVLCGWQGVKGLKGKAAFPMYDHDLFPVGSTKLMLECEKEGLSPNAEDSRGRTPVIMAAIGGHSKAITELARMGADLDKYDSNGLTAYHYAKNMQNKSVMSTLATLGANTDAEPGRMGTSLKWGRVNPALMEAIEQLRVNTVRSLLNSGSSARETDFAGNTPLMVLCCPTDPEARKKVKDKPAKMAKIMDMLLKQKPDVNAVNAAGQTALMRAAADLAKYDENSGMVYELLKAGAYVNDRHGFTRATALCYAGYEAPDLNEKMVERWAWRLMAVGARVRDIQTNGMDAYYISADVESKKKADQKKKEAREKAEKGEETDGEEAGVESTEARSGLQGDINKIKRTNRRDADKKAKDTREKAEGQVPSSTKDLIDGQEDKLNQLIGGDGEEGDGASSSGAQEGQEKEHTTDRVSREVEIGRKDEEEPEPEYKDYLMPGLCMYFGSDMRQRVITADGRGSGSMALRNEITTKARQWLVNFAGQGILSTLGVGPGDNANRQQGNNRQQGGNNNRGGMNGGGNRGGNGGNAGGNRGGNRGGGMNGGGNRGGNGGNRGGNRGR